MKDWFKEAHPELLERPHDYNKLSDIVTKTCEAHISDQLLFLVISKRHCCEAVITAQSGHVQY